MNVTLTYEDTATAVDHGSVVAITGTSDGGARVTFAGDHRPMGELLNLLVNEPEDEITVAVESWQILGVQ